MKLIIEKHPELTRLMDFFAEVEALAMRMGVHIDELNPDLLENTSALHTYFRKNAKAISAYRSALLLSPAKSEEKINAGSPLHSLSILREE